MNMLTNTLWNVHACSMKWTCWRIQYEMKMLTNAVWNEQAGEHCIMKRNWNTNEYTKSYTLTVWGAFEPMQRCTNFMIWFSLEFILIINFTRHNLPISWSSDHRPLAFDTVKFISQRYPFVSFGITERTQWISLLSLIKITAVLIVNELNSVIWY